MAGLIQSLCLKQTLRILTGPAIFSSAFHRDHKNLVSFRTRSTSKEHVPEVSPCQETRKTEIQTPNSFIYIDDDDEGESIALAPSELMKAESGPLVRDALSKEIDFEFLNTVAPPLQKSFNLAPYADKAEVLKQLIKLGVDLSVIERKGTEVTKRLLTLDFEQDVKPRIQFLRDHGVPAKELGRVFTKNPYIFDQDMDHLDVRVRYLKSKGFRKDSITRIISHSPLFLNLNTKAVDSRLGFLQKEFKLTGNEIRFLVTRRPSLLVGKHHVIVTNTFCIREEMGFNEEEVKTLLIDKPKLWQINKDMLSEVFDYFHNKMGISHKILAEFPGALLCRKFIVKQRHEYLVKLGRAQYDPTLPNYVSMKALVSGIDSEFCMNVAKTSVSDFNLFLKTL